MTADLLTIAGPGSGLGVSKVLAGGLQPWPRLRQGRILGPGQGAQRGVQTKG
jgi:hypothetical protein